MTAEIVTRLINARDRLRSVEFYAGGEGCPVFEAREAMAQAAGFISVEVNAPSPWQPIQTAPKDGRSVIAWVPGFGMGAFTLFWSDEGWREPAHMNRLTVEPTYWMAIPALPPSGVIPTPAGTGGDGSHAAAGDDGPGIDQNPSDPTNTEHRV